MMSFFNYHMPPFLNVMGAFYVLVAAPFLISFLRQGYWSGVFSQLSRELYRYRLWIIPVLALELLLIKFADLPVTLWVKALDDNIHAYTFWDFICSCAEGGFVAGFLFTIFMLANYFNKYKLSQVARISLMSSIYGGLANGVLKFIFNRQRPSIGLDQWHFFAFFESGAKHFGDLMYAYNSMPSGHTISTLAAIMPFFLAYQSKKIRIGLVIWALMVNFSRVYTINHWLSDVVMASLLGIIIGVAVFKVNEFRFKK
jgi:membrane-associated phospholipid phosphatase